MGKEETVIINRCYDYVHRKPKAICIGELSKIAGFKTQFTNINCSLYSCNTQLRNDILGHITYTIIKNELYKKMCFVINNTSQHLVNNSCFLLIRFYSKSSLGRHFNELTC